MKKQVIVMDLDIQLYGDPVVSGHLPAWFGYTSYCTGDMDKYGYGNHYSPCGQT